MSTVKPIQVQRYLKGIDYPATKQDLLDAAERNNADENVRSTLERLPDQSFNSPNDVSEAIGKLQ